MRKCQQRADAELPFEAEPDVERDSKHRERNRNGAVLGELLTHLAGDRVDGLDLGSGIILVDFLLHATRDGIGRRIAAPRLGQPDLECFGAAELRDAGLT